MNEKDMEYMNLLIFMLHSLNSIGKDCSDCETTGRQIDKLQEILERKYKGYCDKLLCCEYESSDGIPY